MYVKHSAEKCISEIQEIISFQKRKWSLYLSQSDDKCILETQGLLHLNFSGERHGIHTDTSESNT